MKKRCHFFAAPLIFASLLVFACLGNTITAPQAQATSAETPGEGHNPLVEDLTTPDSLLAKRAGVADGSTVLQTMIDKVKHIDGYVFDSYLTTYEDGRAVEETGKFYFKSPDLIRFEVIKARSRSGAVVVRQPDGRIRGHMGGIFSGIKTTLAPDSRLLRTGNGFNIMQSDIESLLVQLRSRLKSSVNCLAGEVAIAGVHPHIVELVESGGKVDDRIEVDWSDKLPADWSIFHGDKLYSTAKFANLRVRNDLPESLFVLGSEDEAKSVFEDDKPYEGDPVLTRLRKAKVPDRLSGKTVAAIDKVLKLLQAKASDLKPGTILKSTPEGYKWGKGGAQNLLRAATELELLVCDLKAAAPSIKAIEDDAGKVDITPQWLDSVQICSESISRLIDMALNDKPDQLSIDTIRSALSEQEDRLEGLRKQAASLLYGSSRLDLQGQEGLVMIASTGLLRRQPFRYNGQPVDVSREREGK